MQHKVVWLTQKRTQNFHEAQNEESHVSHVRVDQECCTWEHESQSVTKGKGGGVKV